MIVPCWVLPDGRDSPHFICCSYSAEASGPSLEPLDRHCIFSTLTFVPFHLHGTGSGLIPHHYWGGEGRGYSVVHTHCCYHSILHIPPPLAVFLFCQLTQLIISSLLAMFFSLLQFATLIFNTYETLPVCPMKNTWMRPMQSEWGSLPSD